VNSDSVNFQDVDHAFYTGDEYMLSNKLGMLKSDLKILNKSNDLLTYKREMKIQNQYQKFLKNEEIAKLELTNADKDVVRSVWGNGDESVAVSRLNKLFKNIKKQEGVLVEVLDVGLEENVVG
jgi:hypothetical protein